MVFPWCQQQQTAFRAGIEGLPNGLVQLWKAILHEVYHRVAMLISRMGNLLLCLRDESPDEDCSTLRSLQALGGEGLLFTLCPAATAMDGQQWPLQQGEVPMASKRVPATSMSRRMVK